MPHLNRGRRQEMRRGEVVTLTERQEMTTPAQPPPERPLGACAAAAGEPAVDRWWGQLALVHRTNWAVHG